MSLEFARWQKRPHEPPLATGVSLLPGYAREEKLMQVLAGTGQEHGLVVKQMLVSVLSWPNHCAVPGCLE